MVSSGSSIQASIVCSTGWESGGWTWEVLGWDASGAGLSSRGFSEVPSDLGEPGMSGSDPIDSWDDASDLGEPGMSGSDPTDSLGGDFTEGVPWCSSGSVEVFTMGDWRRCLPFNTSGRGSILGSSVVSRAQPGRPLRLGGHHLKEM